MARMTASVRANVNFHDGFAFLCRVESEKYRDIDGPGEQRYADRLLALAVWHEDEAERWRTGSPLQDVDTRP